MPEIERAVANWLRADRDKTSLADGPLPGGGKLAETVMHFARVLRAAGLPAGPGKVMAATEALAAIGLDRRSDVYWALHAVFVSRRDQREVFDQAFHVFWRNPQFLERAMALLLPRLNRPDDEGAPDEKAISRRVAEAMYSQPGTDAESAEEDEEIEIDAIATWSDRDVLRQMDFESMSAAEADAARRALRRLTLPLADLPSRRYRHAHSGDRSDPRATLRRMLRTGGQLSRLELRQRIDRPPPLVVLCDISGSMARYARMLLHFLHALTSDRDRVHSFLFGTRLTNITRHLRHRDPDIALAKIAEAATDWSGGTRIASALHEFNFAWSRRVLGQGAVVLLVTDGLDRDPGPGLAEEAVRLHRSCRRLIWLNPLLRWDGYLPKSQGARALLPNVDELRAVHSLDSLADLATALSAPAPPRGAGISAWRAKLEADAA